MKKFMVSTLAVLALGLSANNAHASGAEPYCREFTQTVSVGSRLQSGYGTACLQPDGAWQIISSNNYVASQPVVMQRVVERPVIIERNIYRRPVYVPESRVVFNFPLWVGGHGSYHHGYYDRHRDRRQERWNDHGRNRGHGHQGRDRHRRDRH